METNVLKEALECLDDERRVLHYFKDKYALYLLESLFINNDRLPITKIQQSKFNKLLHKAVVKEVTSKCGDGFISKDRFENTFLADYESFVLTLSKWGSKEGYPWDQTSRPGSNLVLQLNFTNEHDQYMSQHSVDDDSFKYTGHPIHKTRNSIAWARIDFDYLTGEVLIEEIQNDWLRQAKRHSIISKRLAAVGRDNYTMYGVVYSVREMLVYTANILRRFTKLWGETMLHSTIQFIKNELGFSKIFYHSTESGKVFKNINFRNPPVSIYSELPKKFCFDQVDCGPEFLMSHRSLRRRQKKLKQQSWFYLEI